MSCFLRNVQGPLVMTNEYVLYQHRDVLVTARRTRIFAG